MAAPIQILLVEDDPTWQDGVCQLLQSDPRFALCGVADSYEAAMRIFSRTRPDAVLLDWQIRGIKDGIDVGKDILAQGLPSERIILISGANPASIPKHPFLYVPKNRIADELLSLLTSVTIN